MGSPRAGSNPAADVFSFNKQTNTKSRRKRWNRPNGSKSRSASSVFDRWDMSVPFPTTERCNPRRIHGCMEDALAVDTSPCKRDMSFHRSTKPSIRVRHTTRDELRIGENTREAENSCSMKSTFINSRRRSISWDDLTSNLLLYTASSRSIKEHAEKRDSQTTWKTSEARTL